MLLSHCNSSKWHNSKQCGSKEKIPRVQIRVAIKIYSFIHLFIYSFNSFQKTSKQASKQANIASNYRKADGPTDRPPTTDRPTADDRRRPPTTAADRPTDRRRPPPTADDRPTIDDRRRTITCFGDVVFLHFDGRSSMSDDRPSTVENSIVILS